MRRHGKLFSLLLQNKPYPRILTQATPIDQHVKLRAYSHALKKRRYPPLMAHPLPEVTARDTYAYNSLKFEDSIRVLTLYPGFEGTPLRGSLADESLSEAEPYEAISYVWGQGARCHELFLDPGSLKDVPVSKDDWILPLTPSIHSALLNLRSETEPIRIWADQICINQLSVSERSFQVRLMNEIYQTASHVRVWLGHDEENVAEDAVWIVQWLAEIFDDEKKRGDFKRKYSEELGSQKADFWVPLSKLTKLTWFTRIWIVQEIGTSTPATLHWGNSTLDWFLLSHVTGILNTSFHLLRTRFHIFTPNIRYLHERFVEPDNSWDEDYNRGNFIYELHRARHMHTKDPRDHVYAFLGHYSLKKGGEELKALKPDYGKGLAEVYTDVAIRALKGAKTLISLSAVHTLQAGKGPTRIWRAQERIRIPSWVPDWRTLPVHLIGSPETPHRAAGNTTPQLEIDEDGKVLHIKGKCLDVVKRTWWPMFGVAFKLNGKGSKTPPQVIWEDVTGDASGNKPYSLDIPYVNGKDSAFFALVQTLSNAGAGIDRLRKYDTIPQEEHLANGAAYIVRAKANDAQDSISPELREIAKNGDAFKWSHQATLATRYRRFGLTEQGYYLVGPDSMLEGDAVVMLYGGRTPFLLRKRRDGWGFVGECYVHGLMDGEGLEVDVEEEAFSIR